MTSYHFALQKLFTKSILFNEALCQKAAFFDRNSDKNIPLIKCYVVRQILSDKEDKTNL